MTTKTMNKIVQHKSIHILHNNIKTQKDNGYIQQGEIKLAADGTFQCLMTKDISWHNPNYNPNKPKGWGRHKQN